MKYTIEIGGRTASVEVTDHPDGGYTLSIDEAPPRHVHADAVGAAEWRLTHDNQTRKVALVVRGENVAAQTPDGALFGTAVDPRDQALEALSGGGQGAIKTPMPGAIVRVEVAPGDAVEKGQVLVVVEAMKMENEFRAETSGRVASVGVNPGDSVDAGTVLVVVETDE
ncbi:MAG: biotin/lipoyl-containing protein [Myxococcota bacterium]